MQGFILVTTLQQGKKVLINLNIVATISPSTNDETRTFFHLSEEGIRLYGIKDLEVTDSFQEISNYLLG